ncbi:MAG: hypothetical protein F6K55_33830 [Moorea sp. SIO4A3]|nr:hypothetical protein [Moorena sp. SIO4A3]
MVTIVLVDLVEYNLGQKATLREQATLQGKPQVNNQLTLALAYWPRYANGHAIAFNQLTLNLQPTNLQPWPLATLREQPNNLQPTNL